MSENQKWRQVINYKNYFQDFFKKQPKRIRAKIDWTIEAIEELQFVPELYLKHITNTKGLYEIRVLVGNDIIRIFCFFETGKLVILINGFQKKSQKTPKREIELALKLKAEYENEKFNNSRRI
jgi:phage-related protein